MLRLLKWPLQCNLHHDWHKEANSVDFSEEHLHEAKANG